MASHECYYCTYELCIPLIKGCNRPLDGHYKLGRLVTKRTNTWRRSKKQSSRGNRKIMWSTDELMWWSLQEFVVQHSTNGNPPTFFLTLDHVIRLMKEQDKLDVPYLQRLFPRLQAWYNWFNRTQEGPHPLTYRWKGRNATSDRELNPKVIGWIKPIRLHYAVLLRPLPQD